MKIAKSKWYKKDMTCLWYGSIYKHLCQKVTEVSSLLPVSCWAIGMGWKVQRNWWYFITEEISK